MSLLRCRNIPRPAWPCSKYVYYMYTKKHYTSEYESGQKASASHSLAIGVSQGTRGTALMGFYSCTLFSWECGTFSRKSRNSAPPPPRSLVCYDRHIVFDFSDSRSARTKVSQTTEVHTPTSAAYFQDLNLLHLGALATSGSLITQIQSTPLPHTSSLGLYRIRSFGCGLGTETCLP